MDAMLEHDISAATKARIADIYEHFKKAYEENDYSVYDTGKILGLTLNNVRKLSTI